MALLPTGGDAITDGIKSVKDKDKLHQGKNAGIEKKPVVLDEEKYTESLEKIITRDFFPDLNKLKAQQEYYEALRTNDTEKLRELMIKYGPKRATGTAPTIYDTPATFETPEIGRLATPCATPGTSAVASEGPTHNPEPKIEKDPTDTSLDKFLGKHTSEDDASFAELIEQSEAKEQLRHAWLFDQEKERDEDQECRLALPSIERQAIEDVKGQPKPIASWTYKPKNSLMYIPDTVELSSKELIARQKALPKEIVHSNTRFKADPFDLSKSNQAMEEVASDRAKNLQGKIGADGRLLVGSDGTPNVRGYGFMGTPSPMPGVEDSPLMTWGEIEGTPFRLDGGDTPKVNRTPGPTFRIPDVPRRDQLAMELAEKSRKQHRDKKVEALKQAKATARRSPSPRLSSGKSLERLTSLSPAAQRLAQSKLKLRSGDRALRDSYTPSPGRTGQLTPTPVSRRTPGSSSRRARPASLVSPRTPADGSITPGAGAGREASSITDDLLQLPKPAKRSRSGDS